MMAQPLLTEDMQGGNRQQAMPAKAWADVSETELASLDLRQFLGGRSPFAASDSSIDTAFQLGKAKMAEIVQDRIGFTGGRVLDLLSGFGRWIPFLAQFNREVVALERVADAATLAQNMCAHFGIRNVTCRTGDISRIREFDNGSFDFVWMWSGLQYVERAFALRQARRVLRPGGRLFVGNYNSTGLMGEHVWRGVEQGNVFSGPAWWAIPALARGIQGDGNPSFMDLDGSAEMCERFGFRLVAVAPEDYLDVRRPDGRLPGWEAGRKIGAYFRTVEFVAERAEHDLGAIASRGGRKLKTALRGSKAAIGRLIGR